MKKQSYYVLLLAFASVLVSCGTTNGSKATTSSRNTPAATATSSPTITPTKMQSIKMYLNFEDPTLPLEAKEKTIQILKNRFDNCSYPTTITFENNQIIIIAPESFMDDSVTNYCYKKGISKYEILKTEYGLLTPIFKLPKSSLWSKYSLH